MSLRLIIIRLLSEVHTYYNHTSILTGIEGGRRGNTLDGQLIAELDRPRLRTLRLTNLRVDYRRKRTIYTFVI